MGFKNIGDGIVDKIDIVIPLAYIKEQPGHNFVTFDDAANIFKDVFKGCWGTQVYRKFEHEVMSTKNFSKGSSFQCTIHLSALSNMALPPDDAPADSSSPDSVAEWVCNKIVNHLIANNCVADDFAGHSVPDQFNILINKIQAIPKA